MQILSDGVVGANFRAAMRRFPATVTVITAVKDGIDHGMTVTAVTSVSMDPPSLVVCLNNRTLLHEMLLCQPDFAVNVLSHAQRPLSEAFAGKVEPHARFGLANWRRHEAGMQLLDGANANVVCRRMAAVPYGTHTLFIGQVVHATVDPNTIPLIYEDARYCVSQPAA
ncbi:4-hydroxyphenylacetate 3-monooxygenase [Rhizobium anhuiense]|uniref:4-hydroxyphenylacetate 3-monooxygenase n=1 Tax=Rhizobium anhuiense TaxID=1184720 RepID=A0ABX4IYU7_9HYPH|nr:flavin reductase family protein [Rhizobium anhuiense]PDS40944.1 4-hydroxyphenylacetate 3-monooxygenase [Rhizobium anhuiense]PDS48098.1 4-hydroxyphenylacetate 3-monooxygenase [Rhizobium anhuiense]